MSSSSSYTYRAAFRADFKNRPLGLQVIDLYYGFLTLNNEPAYSCLDLEQKQVTKC